MVFRSVDVEKLIGDDHSARLIWELIGQAIPIPSLAKALSERLHRTVMDNTGITGDFDFKLPWTPATGEFPGSQDCPH